MTNGHSGVHLCGSVPLADSEAVFRQAATRLGDRLRRIPDGETGVRDNWVVWQLPKLQAHPDLETVIPSDPRYGPAPRVRPRPGVDPGSITFGALGYSAAAIESWQVFSRLRDEGVIPPGVRFQVSLPTPVAVVAPFVAEHHPELERAFEARLLAELAEIVAAVPAADLAVQWDTAVEFGILEGVFPAWFGTDDETLEAGIVDRLVRLGDAVPEPVELGYHLCYGDFEHRHFVEPADTSRLASVAARVSAGLGRPLHWLHLPVPRDRADVDYFLPLKALDLPAETTLYLGLVHATDGVEGGLRRIAGAKQILTSFGVSTECGMGRRPAEQIPYLLDVHARLADSLQES
ncbi:MULTISPECIES: hypothetical protein [unclassified Nonomuraea]|uniref:hypothetical protein n=1 Tax=unclassified Nonomuraea TaxID=2593643 RepID=UPI0033D38C83